MSQTVPQTEIPWDSLRGPIEERYLRENKTNKEIIQWVAESRNGLTITKGQLEYQLKKWKIRKNLKKEDYILARIEIDKSKLIDPAGHTVHEVFLNGVRQSSRKLRKGFWRHKAYQEARLTNASELKYYVSDGLEITKPVLTQNASGPQHDAAHLRSPGSGLRAQIFSDATDEPRTRYDLDMHDFVPDLQAHTQIESPQALQEEPRNAQKSLETPSKISYAITRARETNFIYDFIYRTLSVMQNAFWDDLEWEPTVLKLLKTHKLDSLLTCIINLGTEGSVKLGNYLVDAVCYEYQENYDSGDLHLLLHCGCKPAAEALESAYLCADVQKIQYLRHFWDTPSLEMPRQCRIALQHEFTAILEAVALSAGIAEHTALLQIWELSRWRKFPPSAARTFLTFNEQDTVNLEFELLTKPCQELVASSSLIRILKLEGANLDLSRISLFMQVINDGHWRVGRFLSMRMGFRNPSYLLYVISMGDDATTQWLLKAGADPSKCSSIHEACRLEAAMSQLNLGNPVRKIDKVYLVTPLLIAVRSNSGTIINLLLSAGANPKRIGSVPPLYWCIGDGSGCGWESECQYLKTSFDGISPFELAVIRGCGISILEALWVPGSRFRRPEVMWTFSLMYTSVGSPEFDFTVDALFVSQFGWDLKDLQKTRKRRRFHLRWNENTSKFEYTMVLDATATLGSSEFVIQTYSSDRFKSMIYHATKCRGEYHGGTLIDNLVMTGDKKAVDTGFCVLARSLSRLPGITSHDMFSWERNATQALRFVKHIQNFGWDISCEHRSPFLRSIIKSAWRGAIDRSALNKYLRYFSGSNELDSTSYRLVIQLLHQGNVNDNITKLFLESMDESGGGDQGAIDQSVFEVFEYFIDIGWDINEGACLCGETTALDIVLVKCVPNSTTFAIVERLCDAGARISHGKIHHSALSHAIMARRKVFRESFDQEECWALRTIGLLLQVEKQRGYVYDVYAFETKIGVCTGTPLQEAAYYGDLKLARLLIAVGTDADLEASLDHWKYGLSHQISLSPCSKTEVWAHDLKNFIPNFCHGTPLEVAVKQGRQDMVVLLLQAGAKITEGARRQARSIPRILRLL
ncbi:hypothetical protein TWF788_001868 [Orbilia oligospora]|uniref:Clr5 domain-containing protein n=1 Tax=Orbilia oligospora TaxID=2813651 RepID=A0A7C8U4A8_ORBOL|nr:hypothetical protein TWF788_001868 [Orbilia oligospora]